MNELCLVVLNLSGEVSFVAPFSDLHHRLNSRVKPTVIERIPHIFLRTPIIIALTLLSKVGGFQILQHEIIEIAATFRRSISHR